MKPSIKEYIDSLASVIGPHFAPDQCYFGREGALRLARELGFGLADYQDLEISKMLPETYSKLLVIHCFTLSGVPINNDEWIRTIKESIESRREKRRIKLQLAI